MLLREEWHGPLTIHVFDGKWGDAEMVEYLALLDKNLRNHRPYVVICDATTSAAMEARQAKMLAAWIKVNHDELKHYCYGMAFILPSAFMRGVLRAMLAFQALPYPYVVRNSMAEAVAWTREQIAPEVIPWP